MFSEVNQISAMHLPERLVIEARLNSVCSIRQTRGAQRIGRKRHIAQPVAFWQRCQLRHNGWLVLVCRRAGCSCEILHNSEDSHLLPPRRAAPGAQPPGSVARHAFHFTIRCRSRRTTSRPGKKTQGWLCTRRYSIVGVADAPITILQLVFVSQSSIVSVQVVPA